MTGRPSIRGSLYRLRLRLARWALLWERAWPACWPAVAAIGTFLVLALFDLLPLLPGPLHAAVLLALAGGLAVAAVRVYRIAAFPDLAAGRRRIERASGLAHRPLAALADRPSSRLDGAATRLWEAHRRRMAAAAQHLRVGWPAAGFAPRDPWGLRALLAILLVLAGIDAGSEWRDRLLRALAPGLGGGAPAIAASLDIWVAPPEYTGLPPLFLHPGARDAVRIPTGSKLLAQVHGGDGLPQLTIDRERHDFTAVDKENFRIATTLGSGSRLLVSQGGTILGSWPIEIIPDHPPLVAFARQPEPTPRAALRLDYKASDDYGVEAVKAVIRRSGGDPKEAAITLDLPLPGLHLKEAAATSYHDLSPHPWAGLPVEIRLLATDALGQTGESSPLLMKLPERVFRHPVARAIIDERKELVQDPTAREPVAEILGDLQSRPRLYRDDGVVFLGLRVAAEELRSVPGGKALSEVEQLLWDTALRIEDGNMSLAERDLRRLEQQLQEALARNAPDAEVEKLMQQLRQALDRYLQSLAQNLARHPDQRQQPLDHSRILSGKDLQRMLDRARELARNGDREQARQLLSQLQNMLENLRMAQPGQMQQRGAGQAQQMMRDMREMMRRQQQLLDRSFRAEQQGQQSQQGRPGQQSQQGEPGEPSDEGGAMSGELGDAAGQQDALRHRLGDMMRRLGEGLGDIPDPFGRAERAMRGATDALRQGQPGEAIAPQTEALDQLQQAARDFAQQMQRRLGGPPQPGEGEMGATDRQPRDWDDRDPLGRPLSNDGGYDQGDVKIPDQGTLQRARRILDELRRRAGERTRPEIELDYIDRLLQRF